MNKHYFTIAIGYPEKVQVIEAESPERAEQIMFARFGKYWAFQYTEKEWQQALDDGFFKNVHYLPVIKDEVGSNAKT